jgi:hypothetical protein
MTLLSKAVGRAVRLQGMRYERNGWSPTGPTSIRPLAAALANAVFDASGVRLRRAPMTPERLNPALA